MSSTKNSHGLVTVQLAGGLGNQLFQYAAARRLTLKNHVPLKLDKTYMSKDYYQRVYSLKHFSIKEDFASPSDCFLGRIGRLRRWVYRWFNKYLPFENRSYIQEEFDNYDSRLTSFKVTRKVYLAGYWQSEKYFRDIETILRKELQIKGPHGQVNIEMGKLIQNSESVCIHIRRLHGVPNTPGAVPLGQNDNQANYLDISYYKKAIHLLLEQVKNPHFFIFADYPAWARENLCLDYPSTYISHNASDKDYEDLWLMSLCKHFVIANSTFSWWGAWLGNFRNKIVVAPFSGV